MNKPDYCPCEVWVIAPSGYCACLECSQKNNAIPEACKKLIDTQVMPNQNKD